MGPRNVRGVGRNGAGTHVNPATGGLGDAPDGATERVRGLPKCKKSKHEASCTAGAVAGAFGGSP
eukprot:8417403-Pyramimonas_sp.AAC.1